MKYIAVIVFFAHMSMANAQKLVDKETHGTINVVLSNKNGAVIVTDSKISSQSGPSGYAEKLFLLSNRAACAIAGYYDNQGAQVADSSAKDPINPLNLSVPSIIQNFIENAKDSDRTEYTIKKQLEDLSEIYAFVMEIAADLIQQPTMPKPSSAVITVVGYEGKNLRLAGVTLVPYRVGRVWIYLPTDPIDQDLSGGTFERVKGVENIAQQVKQNPKRFENAPLLKDFAAFIRGEGKDLDLEELTQVAADLEIETANRYPNIVGGERQTATFKDGTVSYKGPTWPSQRPFSAGLFVFHHLTSSGNVNNPVRFPRKMAQSVLFIDAKLSDSVQLLDGIGFVGSSIDHCTLRYDGLRPTSLGSSNRISNSRLLVGQTVSPSDPFLKRVKVDFPELTIVQQP